MLPSRRLTRYTSLAPSYFTCLSAFSTSAIRATDTSDGATNHKLTGSAKLHADAALEESTPRPKSQLLTALESEQENWTGEERVQDAVLRMLVDKYKPLRTGTIRSADEKLRDRASSVNPTNYVGLNPLTNGPAAGGSWADVPLIPAVEGHRPWHTTYKAPENRASVHVGRLSPGSTRRASAGQSPDEQERRKQVTQRRKAEFASRLIKVKDGALDYRLGIKGEAVQERRNGPVNPVSVRGWAGLIEDKIERARAAGAFNVINGRGKPLEQSSEQSNPFIGREEFLLNRIIRKNGASPPWVDAQVELDTALSSFRGILRQTWIRRAIRTLGMRSSQETVSKMTVEYLKAIRDLDWEAKERGYHQVALEDVNKLVRKYNGMAPYPVRRSPYQREDELLLMYRDSAEEILQGLHTRGQSSARDRNATSEDSLAENSSYNTGTESLSIWGEIRKWIRTVFGMQN
jgi:DnaJ family protein C protein 28